MPSRTSTGIIDNAASPGKPERTGRAAASRPLRIATRIAMTTETPSYVIMLTRFDGETDRVATALALANGALAAGSEVLLWLTVDGAKLARHGAADALVAKNFPPVAELLALFVECGGRIGVCPPCGDAHGITDETLLPGAQWMGAAAMLLEARDRQVFSF